LKPVKKDTVVFVDGLAPVPSYGAGHGRACDVITALVELGFKVIVAIGERRSQDTHCLPLWPEGRVHLVYLSNETPLKTLLLNTARSIRAIWISRTHNIDRTAKLVLNFRTTHPETLLVGDTEALTKLRYLPSDLDIHDHKNSGIVNKTVFEQLKSASRFDNLVCVNDFEVQLAQRALPAVKVSKVSSSFPTFQQNIKQSDRKHFLFLGAFHVTKCPNMATVYWFCRYALPKIKMALPDAEFHIAGHLQPSVEFPDIVAERAKIIGPTDDLPSLLSQYRVFAAPTRIAAGIPHKVLQAMSLGLPAVISDLLGNQLPHDENLLPYIASPLDPAIFSRKCVELYTDTGLWEKVRRDSLEEIATHFSPERFTQSVNFVLKP